MLTSRISSKGQITLPKRVRRALDVKPGMRISFVVNDNKVVLQPIVSTTARALAGSLARYRKPGSILRVRERVRKEVARAAAREG
jgi:AbrB family looped-hinge helix DNA binding protein